MTLSGQDNPEDIQNLELEGEQNDEETSQDNLNSQEEQSPEGNDENKNEEEPFVEVEGEKVPLSQIKEWRDGAMMRADYTRKTQELADLRKQYEEAIKEIKENEKYGDVDEEGRAALELIDKRIEEIINEKLEPLKQQQEDAEVQREIEEIKSKYNLSENDTLDLLRFADENNMPSLEAAYKVMYFDKARDNSRIEGEQKAKQNLEKRKPAIVESGQSGDKNVPSKVDVSKMDYDEITELAKKQAGL